MSPSFDSDISSKNSNMEANGFRDILQRLNQKMYRDHLVQSTADQIRQELQVDRVLLYYFYVQWEGQVTVESLSNQDLSISGSTGPHQCFTDEYAATYLAGRVRAIADIEIEPINDCHRDFLRDLQVRANLVVPILTPRGLWGLLVAHHCQGSRHWSEENIEQMKKAALVLATAPSIRNS